MILSGSLTCALGVKGQFLVLVNFCHDFHTNTVKISPKTAEFFKMGPLPLFKFLAKSHLETMLLCLPHHSSLNDDDKIVTNDDYHRNCDGGDVGCYGDGESDDLCAEAKCLLKSDQILMKK